MYAILRKRIRVDQEPKPRPVFSGVKIFGRPSSTWWDDIRGERLLNGLPVPCGRGHTLWLSLDSLSASLEAAEQAGIDPDMFLFSEAGERSLPRTR